ncbi:restriction endonuclease [Longimicrobium terrae]|uniref:Restriction endonuclease type IV Mrr domain-containing protein n=1 Tax=Longimicrobium terrae TaxID=1639882 RepID=A0A841GVL2_9BACT|nr:restriction endonuclease [Longimicrobium terrae]MBB4635019.1 hypothetical protein [Longimicrobium terrae]MBB6069413.1 hypothetical protein [Longimicrobium terrae]NNC31781.1 hypothetical protein [Longimicrobium terrae]
MANPRKPVARPKGRAVNTGKALEQEVFDTLNKMVSTGSLPLDPRSCLVRLNPSYYSQIRKEEIIFDVSIEATIPGAESPFLLWIWECKDYSSAVPVRVVEEFSKKLDQIGGHGTKGTIITRGAYQKSAINVAESSRMGLARLLPEGQVDWVIQRSLPGNMRLSVIPETYTALTTTEFVAQNQNFYGFTAAGRTMAGLSLEDFIRLSVEEWQVEGDQST